MDSLSVFLFAMSGITLAVGAFYLMHSAATSEPMKNYRTGTWTTKVKRPVHPEMRDVEPGTELMGVNFGKTECDLEEYKDLQARIDELKRELEEFERPDLPSDDEEDDEEGGLVVRK